MRSRVLDMGPLSKWVEYVLSSLRSEAGGSFLRALEVGDESVVVRTRYDLHEFVSVLAPLIEDLLVAWTMSGTVTYSHLVMILLGRVCVDARILPGMSQARSTTRF